MKKNLLLFSGLLVSLMTNAQWTDPNPTTLGNVGIGTTNPEGSLQVGNYTTNETLNIASGSNGTGTIYFKDLNSTEGGGIKVTGIAGGSKMEFFNRWNIDETKVIFDLSSGKIGIGTNSPGDQLEVLMSSQTNGDGISIKAINSSGAGSQPGIAFKDINGNRIASVNTDHDSKDLRFLTNGIAEAMRINSEGKVGIGTINPDAELTVKGSIHAEEVKVDLNIPAPDYVFESDYELRTLKETKEYIAKNKHLPEIPSAVEISENGINLGDMNMRLLKKIEELTLYQIELLEQQEVQNTRMAKLEKKLLELTN